MAEKKPSIDDIAVDIKDVEKKLAEMKIKDLEIGGMREFKPKSPLAISVYVIGLAMSFFHIWVLTIRAIAALLSGCSRATRAPSWMNGGTHEK